VWERCLLKGENLQRASPGTLQKDAMEPKTVREEQVEAGAKGGSEDGGEVPHRQDRRTCRLAFEEGPLHRAGETMSKEGSASHETRKKQDSGSAKVGG